MNFFLNKNARFAAGYLALVILCYSSAVSSATLTSNVNRNQIGLGETLMLQLTYDEKADSSQLNFSPLSKDFDILGVSPQTSSNVAIINGKVNSVEKTTWVVTLAPKREGNLTIPEFQLGSARSNAITVRVSKTPGGAAAQPLSAKISIDKGSVYVDEEIYVRVEISAQNGVSNLNGAPLQLDDAEIQPLEQQTSQKVDNGIARQIIVLRYLVYPKTAGTLTIPAQTFTGVVGGSRGVFDSFRRRGQQVVARTPARTITIKPPSEKNQNIWFPADNVSLSSEWSGDTNNLTVGEPITRTIRVTALGQRANIIPPLPQAISASSTKFKVYKDKPQLENQSRQNTVVGIRTEAQAIVPSTDGQIELAEQRLEWWSNKSQSWQQAVLAAETLMVTGSASASSALVDRNPLGTQGNSIPSAAPGVAETLPIWGWKLASLLLAMLVLVLSLIIYRLLNPASEQTTSATTPSQSEQDAWLILRQKFKTGRVSEIRNALMNWAKLALPSNQINGLQNLCQQCSDPELAEQLSSHLNELDQHLYRDGGNFDASRLAKSLPKLRKEILAAPKNAKQAQGDLQSLYPA